MGARSRLISMICASLAVALLFAGYAAAGLWFAVPFIPLLVMAWWVIFRNASRWVPMVLLVVYVIEAAGGILAGANAAWFIAGCGLMLACLEASGKVDRRGHDSMPASGKPDNAMRMSLLALSAGGGVLLAEIGLQVQVSLPFIVVVIAALAVVFGLLRFFGLFLK